jgi:two-component system chemotaxis response regulator CheB
LQAGALAFVARPAGTQADLELKHLRHVIKDVAAVRLDDRWFGVRHSSTRTEWPERGAPKPPQIIAIGASTGGPHALHEILTRLPATFPTPLVIVQHIGEGFDGGLVSWLGSQCALPVQLGVAGARLDRPGIHIAPTGHHLGVRGRRIELTNAPPVSGHRPSATLLFRSVAEEYQAAAVGILLTGMGNDGAAGLRALREAGATTVAQDRLSSVVFGMPSVAIDDGVVDYVLSPEAMVALLVNTLVPSGGR